MKDYEYYFNKIKNYLKKEDLWILVTILITGFVNYIFLLTHNCLSHDGLFNGPIFFSGGWEFDLGRPLLILLDKLKGGLVAPSIIFIIGLVFIYLTIILIKNSFNIKRKVPILLITIFLVIFPTIADGALYIYFFDGYTIALFLATLGATLIIKKKYLLAIIPIICSLALYQAYISITITLILINFIINLLEEKGKLKDLIIDLLFVIISLICYFVILKLGMSLIHRSFAEYKGASSFGIETFTNLPNSIINCYKDFFDYLFNDSIIINSYFKRNIMNAILLVIFIITIIINLIKMKKNTNKLLLIISILILPIIINIMNLIACETRIICLTAIGYYAFYLLLILVIDKYLNINILKNIFIITTISLIFTISLSDNAEAMARNDIHNNFYTKTLLALDKAQNIDGYAEDKKWMFSDIYRYSSPLTNLSIGFASKEFETYDNFLGLTGIKIFYKRFHGIDIDLVDEETYYQIINTTEFKQMKIDEIKVINDIIVVKTSDITM